MPSDDAQADTPSSRPAPLHAETETNGSGSKSHSSDPDITGLRGRKIGWGLLAGFGCVVLAVAAATGWLSFRAIQVSDELRSAEALVPKLKGQIASEDTLEAQLTLDEIAGHTRTARNAADDPVWTLAATFPVLGANLSVVKELAVAADEVVIGSAEPLLRTAHALQWDSLGPSEGKLNATPLKAAAPSILAAANTLDLTYNRIRALDASHLLPQVADPLARTTAQLGEMNESLGAVADAAALLPSMLGTQEARNYLVLIQNSAEVRATGGLPGALAVIRVDNGAIEFVSQSSGSAMGKNTTVFTNDDEQTAIYTSRLGTFIGDVNLTPDFPTAARNAKAMWEARYGGEIDGVIAIDPVVLAHLLEASGPIALGEEDISTAGASLPVKLTSENVVSTLLSDVYRALDTNEAQDAYFAAASQKVFSALTSGRIEGPALLKSLTKSYEENRLHLWSSRGAEQEILKDIRLGGAISGTSAGGAAFGVYFNDGTGAKMDYYVRRRVQLEQICSSDGYSQYKVKITLTNTAPLDAATSLPTAVTGGGKFGTPAGSVQTNIVVYGPALSHIDTTAQDGMKVGFGSHLHSARPVGVHAIRLAPGETTNVEMVFVNVVQDAAPSLAVTPTVEAVKDVTLPTLNGSCAG